MKNRKIIALLCAMAMIVTTLSSILVVSAASAPQITVSVGEKDADNQYTVTVGYTGYTDGTIAALGIQIPLPDGTTYVDGSVTALLDTIKVSYASKSKEIRLTGAEPAGLLKDESADLLSFKVTVTEDAEKAGVDFKVKDEGYLKVTAGETDTTGTTYIVGDSENPLVTTADSIEYVREWGDGEPSFTMVKSLNEDGSYKITVGYDISKVDEKTPLIAAISATLPLPDGVTYVDKSLTALAGDSVKVSYGAKSNSIKISAAEPAGLLSSKSGDLLSFDVKFNDGVTSAKFAFGEIIVKATESEEDTTGVTYTLGADTNNVYAPSIKVTAGETPAEPTVEPTTEPTVEPTTEPTVEPSAEPTETPSASTNNLIDVTVDSVDNNFGSGSAYKVTLKNIAPEGTVLPEKVDVVLQGYAKAKAQGSTVGYVTITVDTANLDTAEFTGFVSGAKGVAVNVYDSSNIKSVVADRVVK
jgi:hypothetical protein